MGKEQKTKKVSLKKKNHNRSGVKVEVDGIVFDSKFEADHYLLLRQQQEDGLIYDLLTKETFPLQNPHIAIKELRGPKVRTYTPDFTYKVRDEKGIRTIAIETKGRMEPVHSLRMSCFEAIYPWIELKVIRQNKRKKRRKAK
jgi:hypothetical protein